MDYIQQKEKLNKVIMELRRESCELELEAALHVLNECQNQLAPNVQPIKKKITKQVSWAESVDDTAQSSSTVKDAINHDENASKSEDDLKVQTKRNGESQDRLKLLELCIAQIKMEQSMDMDISTEPEKRVLFPIVEEEEEEERNDPIDTLDETVNVDGDIEQGNSEPQQKRQRWSKCETVIFSIFSFYSLLMIVAIVLLIVFLINDWKIFSNLEIRPMNVFTRH